ncbi:ECF transporter S component [Fructobacillus sp. M2-14]|uniref:ECF transporter S component n=1 Tax=Fructobacillus broussonetiae TaxID=2713173 RepID=A0ABS5R1Q1_9LACO|nr:ECF transporter S component [Fructobacillus broussonetiae]MBS9338474.1 ECF transporter S component [Fructobacillus broussonetiae]
MNTNTKNQKFVATTIFVAIILLQSAVPFLGYVPLGAFFVGASAVILPATVSLAAIVLGAKPGMIVAFFWASFSFVRALLHPGTFGALLFSNPVIAYVPRILVGLIIGLVAKRFLQNKTSSLRLFSLGAMSALINTAFAILFAWLSLTILPTNAYGIPSHNLLFWLVSVLAFNFVFEVVMNGLIVMAVGRVLVKKND